MAMMRLITSILLIILCALAASAWVVSPIAGRWNCVSTDERGTEVAWTLVLTDVAGKLSGSVIFGQTTDEVQILEPALNGNVLSFKIPINAEETVELTGRVDGSKLEGTFKGKASGKGTFKGTRQA
jgi:hypothetical protein